METYDSDEYEDEYHKHRLPHINFILQYRSPLNKMGSDFENLNNSVKIK